MGSHAVTQIMRAEVARRQPSQLQQLLQLTVDVAGVYRRADFRRKHKIEGGPDPGGGGRRTPATRAFCALRAAIAGATSGMVRWPASLLGSSNVYGRPLSQTSSSAYFEPPTGQIVILPAQHQ